MKAGSVVKIRNDMSSSRTGTLARLVSHDRPWPSTDKCLWTVQFFDGVTRRYLDIDLELVSATR